MLPAIDYLQQSEDPLQNLTVGAQSVVRALALSQTEKSGGFFFAVYFLEHKLDRAPPPPPLLLDLDSPHNVNATKGAERKTAREQCTVVFFFFLWQLCHLGGWRAGFSRACR